MVWTYSSVPGKVFIWSFLILRSMFFSPLSSRLAVVLAFGGWSICWRVTATIICSTIVYGGIMNPASALMWSNTVNLKIILSYYITGIPVDLVRAVATFFFLWLGAESMLEKLDRIKVKYGLAE